MHARRRARTSTHTHACTHEHAPTRTSARTLARSHACMHTRTQARTNARTHFMEMQRTHARTRAHALHVDATHARMHERTHAQAHTHTHAPTCTRRCTPAPAPTRKCHVGALSPIKEVCVSTDECSLRNDLEDKLAEVNSEEHTIEIFLRLQILQRHNIEER